MELVPAVSVTVSFCVAHVSQFPVLAREICRTLVPLTYRLTRLAPATGFGPFEYRSPAL
jgi:hypothetical protein